MDLAKFVASVIYKSFDHTPLTDIQRRDLIQLTADRFGFEPDKFEKDVAEELYKMRAA